MHACIGKATEDFEQARLSGGLSQILAIAGLMTLFISQTNLRNSKWRSASIPPFFAHTVVNSILVDVPDENIEGARSKSGSEE